MAGCRAVASAAVVAVALSFVWAEGASAQEAVTPEEGEAYTIDTYFTGPCEPESELPAPSFYEQETRTSTTETFFVYTDAGDSFREHIYPTDDDDPNGYQAFDGPCIADPNGSTIGGVPAVGGPIHPLEEGKWFTYSQIASQSYGCCPEPCPDPGPCDTWGDSGSPDEPVTIRQASFKVYNPCTYTVKSVKGIAVVRRVGSSNTSPLKAGSQIGETDVVEVRANGELVLEGGDGVQLTVRPGTYPLGNRRQCRIIGAPLPKAPPPVTVEEGGVIERSTSELGATIEAGNNIRNEGIFSNFRTHRGVPGEVAFKVNRSERRGKTTSCALKGRLAVYTTDRDVPARKRRIELDQGECAVTRDGGPPRRQR